MPAKSKRRKGRFPAQSQKRKPVTVAPATAVEQPAEAVQAPKPAPRPKSPAAARQAAAKPAEVVRRVPVSTELRNIAIIAGVILIILITIGVILR